jgi:hypothetical protein
MDPTNISPDVIDTLSKVLEKKFTASALIAVGIVAILWLLNKWIDIRSKDKSNAAKILRERTQEQADEHRERVRIQEHKELLSAMNQLISVNKERIIHEESAFSRLIGLADETQGIVSGMHKVVGDLLSRQAGAINRDDSLRLVERFFMFDVRVDVIAVFNHSLEKDDFVGRAQFVEQRVKSMISQILENTEKALSVFKISISLDQFFPVTSQGGVRHYKLCDILWDVIKPLYTHRASLPDRLEEMRLVIQSKLREFVQNGFHSVHEVYHDNDPKPKRYVRMKTEHGIIMPPESEI